MKRFHTCHSKMDHVSILVIYGPVGVSNGIRKLYQVSKVGRGNNVFNLQRDGESGVCRRYSCSTQRRDACLGPELQQPGPLLGGSRFHNIVSVQRSLATGAGTAQPFHVVKDELLPQISELGLLLRSSCSSP